jgi:hypothetical protein
MGNLCKTACCKNDPSLLFYKRSEIEIITAVPLLTHRTSVLYSRLHYQSLTNIGETNHGKKIPRSGSPRTKSKYR